MTFSQIQLKKPVIAGLAAGLLVLSPAAAATDHASVSASKSEAVGVGAGAVIGGAVGGPVGAIIGAAIGGHYGDTHHQSKTREAQVARSESDLVRSKGQLKRALTEQARLDSELLQAQDELDALIAEIDALFVERALVDGLQFDVHFDTDDSALADADQNRLLRLSELLKAVPEAEVELHGFADARGNAAYNEELSLDRAHTVADSLAALGVPLGQIRTFAQGESQAIDRGSDIESYSHDRRVSIQLQLPISPEVRTLGDTERKTDAQPRESAAIGQ